MAVASGWRAVSAPKVGINFTQRGRRSRLRSFFTICSLTYLRFAPQLHNTYAIALLGVRARRSHGNAFMIVPGYFSLATQSMPRGPVTLCAPTSHRTSALGLHCNNARDDKMRSMGGGVAFEVRYCEFMHLMFIHVAHTVALAGLLDFLLVHLLLLGVPPPFGKGGGMPVRTSMSDDFMRHLCSCNRSGCRNGK